MIKLLGWSICIFLVLILTIKGGLAFTPSAPRLKTFFLFLGDVWEIRGNCDSSCIMSHNITFTTLSLIKPGKSNMFTFKLFIDLYALFIFLVDYLFSNFSIWLIILPFTSDFLSILTVLYCCLVDWVYQNR